MESIYCCCISYYSYIKPQPCNCFFFILSVVYRTIPTSNHNFRFFLCFNTALYIVLFLHQTTTEHDRERCALRCISYYSYIKPQPNYESARIKSVVYRTIPTSNHNTCILCVCARIVVYRTIPTSNHNSTIDVRINFMLYIVLFLHQTTTFSFKGQDQRRCISYYSYIKPQPTWEHYINTESCISYYSYIKPQQWSKRKRLPLGCISYYSYIKPQLNQSFVCYKLVVYRTIPTSNHNNAQVLRLNSMLYIVLFLQQTTTHLP